MVLSQLVLELHDTVEALPGRAPVLAFVHVVDPAYDLAEQSVAAPVLAAVVCQPVPHGL